MAWQAHARCPTDLLRTGWEYAKLLLSRAGLAERGPQSARDAGAHDSEELGGRRDRCAGWEGGGCFFFSFLGFCWFVDSSRAGVGKIADGFWEVAVAEM